MNNFVNIANIDRTFTVNIVLLIAMDFLKQIIIQTCSEVYMKFQSFIIIL